MSKDNIKLEIKLPPENPMSDDELHNLTNGFMGAAYDAIRAMTTAIREANRQSIYASNQIIDFIKLNKDLGLIMDCYLGKRGIYRKDGERIK